MRKLIHIPLGTFRDSRISLTGVLMILATVVAVIGYSCPASAQSRLVVAQSATWRTDALIANTSDAAQFVSFSDCLSQGASITLQPNDAFRVKDVGQWQCGMIREFYTIPAQFNATTFLRFDDGHTKASFSVPPVGAIQPGGWLRVSPVVNDADFVTSINVFPTGIVRVFVDVFDATNHKIGSEAFDAQAPVAQYALKTKFRVGSLQISTQSFGCVGCQAQPLYGFVITSDPSGGNARVLPF